MKKFVFLIAFGLMILSATIIADFTAEKIELQKGKNSINVDFEFSPMYASDLIRIYPQIEVISLNESGNLQGYVNVFGGVGNDFVFKANKTYEIITKQNITLSLK